MASHRLKSRATYATDDIPAVLLESIPNIVAVIPLLGKTGRCITIPLVRVSPQLFVQPGAIDFIGPVSILYPENSLTRARRLGTRLDSRKLGDGA